MTNDPQLRGQASRGAILWVLMSSLGNPLLVAVGGLTASLFAVPPIKWFFQFIGTLGLWSLVATVKGELRRVVWFEHVDDGLEYRRLGRSATEFLPLAEVTDVHAEWAGSRLRLAVRSHDAYSLLFDSACLPGVHELQPVLASRPQTTLDAGGRIAGAADAGQREIDFAIYSMRRALCVGLVLIGVFLFYLALAGGNLIPDPGIFMVAGTFSACAGVAGYFVVARVRSRQVTWFECLGDQLRLRVQYERKVRELSLASLELIERQRKTSRKHRGDWLFRMRLQGVEYVLDEGVLSNLAALIDRLAAQLALRPATRQPVERPEPPAANDERVSRLLPHLEQERIVWIGRPGNAGMVWRLRFQALFGLVMLAGAGTCLVFLVAKACVGEFWALAFTIPALMAVLMGWGAYAVARELHRSVALSIYAVTDRRAIILGGLYGNPYQTFLDPEGPVVSYTPEQLLNYELSSQRESVILDGFWVSLKRNEIFRPIGFLECADAPRAAHAIEWLLETHGIRDRRIPVTAASKFLGH